MLVAPRLDELPPLAQPCSAVRLTTKTSRAVSKSRPKNMRKAGGKLAVLLRADILFADILELWDLRI